MSKKHQHNEPEPEEGERERHDAYARMEQAPEAATGVENQTAPAGETEQPAQREALPGDHIHFAKPVTLQVCEFCGAIVEPSKNGWTPVSGTGPFKVRSKGHGPRSSDPIRSLEG